MQFFLFFQKSSRKPPPSPPKLKIKAANRGNGLNCMGAGESETPPPTPVACGARRAAGLSNPNLTCAALQRFARGARACGARIESCQTLLLVVLGIFVDFYVD